MNDTLDTPTFDVAAFAASVRETRMASGKTLAGPNRLSTDILSALHSTANEICRTTFMADLKPEHIEELGKRFEEMCRRQKQDIDPARRPYILRYLGAELAANYKDIGGDIADMIPVTIYHSVIIPALKNEFQDFADTPWLIKQAAVHYPSDPRAFLRQVRSDIAGITNEAEFQDFADTPWLIKQAAVNYPSDPRAFLRHVRSDIAAITNEAEFQDFADTPGLIKQAAVGYPSDPRAFLQQKAAGYVLSGPGFIPTAPD